MSAVVCPTCGAGEGMNCSTVRGNDHRKRMLAEIAELGPRVPEAVSTALVDERDPQCVKAWPGCHSFGFDPKCCRFPKSCSAGAVRLAPAETLVRCDYCGGALPSVQNRADVPTTPDLRRLGFDAAKVVCPACVERDSRAEGDRNDT